MQSSCNMKNSLLLLLFVFVHIGSLCGQQKKIQKIQKNKSIDSTYVKPEELLVPQMSVDDQNMQDAQPGSTSVEEQSAQSFILGTTDFLLNGQPFQIISGEMHYCRIPKPYWRHRMKMAKAMGLNTISTYVMWNFHESKPGKFDFETDERDLNEFINIAKDEGLYVLLRPGPYVCAEWEFGGYPWWLLQDTDLKIRANNKKFLKLTENYFKALYKAVGHQQFTKGGPILMVQVENEYGSFGNDLDFIRANRDLLLNVGFDVPLFSADGNWLFKNAAVLGVLPGANGETNPKKLKESVDKYNGNAGPYFTPEWYPGWLDHWGEPKQKVEAEKLATELDTLLMNNISVNFYMFHGGTNFGFWNGANYTKEQPIQPDITSYDYDAPLSESGVATEKFRKLRDVIRKYLPDQKYQADIPSNLPTTSFPFVELKTGYNIFDQLPTPVSSVQPKTMESLNQGFGYILYRTNCKSEAELKKLKVPGLRDFATVYINGEYVGKLDRRTGLDSLFVKLLDGENQIDIFVENMGRINYGSKILDNYKGIVGEVFLAEKPLRNWKHYGFPFDRPDMKKGKLKSGSPCVVQGTFMIKNEGDTFLDMRGWNKGVVWVNGHNLGKFWNLGPQQTLFVPGCWLKNGKNEIVIFEQFYYGQNLISSIKAPILDQLNPDVAK